MGLIDSYRHNSRSVAAQSGALEAIHHHGERGSEREAIIKEFISARLPDRFAVGNGEIWAANGKWSGQEDLIIYDRLESPRIFAGGTTQIIGVENVAAVVEVKTRLDSKEMERATRSIASARRLQKTGMATKVGTAGIRIGPSTPVFGALFAFATDLKTETFVENWTRNQFSVPENERINLACILGNMFIIYVDQTFHLWDASDPARIGEFVFVKAGDDALLAFLLLLIRIASEFSSGVPDLFKYAFEDSQGLKFEMVHARMEAKADDRP